MLAWLFLKLLAKKLNMSRMFEKMRFKQPFIGVGAACIILIPELHKKKNVALALIIVENYQGLGLTYTIGK